ncbi:MAG: phosphatase PAP2 family protein [Fibrobacterota bacterium]
MWYGFSLLLFTAVAVTGANEELFLLINHRLAFAGEQFWVDVTNLGDGFICSFFLFIFIRKRPRLVGHFLLAGIICGIQVALIKELMGVSRPPAVLNPQEFHIFGPALVSRSFPSGHTATITTICAIAVAGIAKAWIKTVFICLALLVGISRIAVGVHWPLDVLAGFMVATLTVTLTKPYVSRVKLLYRRETVHFYGLFAAAIALLVLSSYTSRYADARLSQSILTGLLFAVTLFQYIQHIRRSR